MPGDLIFAIIMLIACIIMIVWTLHDYFKINDESLAMGMPFWVTIYFFGAIICGTRIVVWY